MPLINKKKNHKSEWKMFLTIVKGNLEEDFDGCKKLHKEDEFKVKTIPEEVQPLLIEFTDVTPSEMSDRLPPLGHRPSFWCNFA